MRVVANAMPRPPYPWKRGPVPTVWDAVGNQSQNRWGCKRTRPQLGFNPWIIQPVVSRYTDCAVPALLIC